MGRDRQAQTVMQTRLLLHDAQAAGFSVEVVDGYLDVKGPPERGDIMSEIKAHKAEIADIISNPEGIGEYADRLRKGIDWLETCFQRVLDDPFNQRMVDAVRRNLHRWADLDEELRQVFPEFRGCPIDGCKDTAPVRCLYCAESAASKARP